MIRQGEYLRRTPPPPYLSVSQAAIVLRCSRESVRRYVKAGHLTPLPDLPRTNVFRFDDVATLAARLMLYAAELAIHPDDLLDTGTDG